VIPVPGCRFWQETEPDENHQATKTPRHKGKFMALWLSDFVVNIQICFDSTVIECSLKRVSEYTGFCKNPEGFPPQTKMFLA
jgi:hypothetical protein